MYSCTVSLGNHSWPLVYNACARCTVHAWNIKECSHSPSYGDDSPLSGKVMFGLSRA
jgi:hypothetical protein